MQYLSSATIYYSIRLIASVVTAWILTALVTLMLFFGMNWKDLAEKCIRAYAETHSVAGVGGSGKSIIIPPRVECHIIDAQGNTVGLFHLQDWSVAFYIIPTAAAISLAAYKLSKQIRRRDKSKAPRIDSGPDTGPEHYKC